MKRHFLVYLETSDNICKNICIKTNNKERRSIGQHQTKTNANVRSRLTRLAACQNTHDSELNIIRGIHGLAFLTVFSVQHDVRRISLNLNDQAIIDLDCVHSEKICSRFDRQSNQPKR